MSGAQIQIEAGGTFTRDPEYTLFSRTYETHETYLAESIEIPFDRSRPEFGGTVSARLPPKGDIVRRITVRSTLPELYTPLGPGYVYPLYTDQVDGNVFVSTDTLAIAPGDFVGYFNTQYLNFWATNFTGYTMNVAYDSTVNKFVFSSSAYSNIFFKNDSSGVFWGFDPRTFDFVTPAGYKGYRLTSNTLVAPLTLVQTGWIRGFTPPPTTGFSYKDSVACRLIKSATLSIGGQTIDRLTSERLIIEDDLSVPYENQAALTILEGKNDPAGVYAPREYYTRLTFNMDTLPVTQMYRNDVRVDLEYEKFANLPTAPITTNSLTDGTSYVNTQYKTLLGIPANYRVFATLAYKNYIIYVMDNFYARYTFWFYDTTKPVGLASSWTSWTDTARTTNTRPFIVGGSIYYTSDSDDIIRVPIDDMIAGTAVATVGPQFLNGLYHNPFPNKMYRIGFAADARYLYTSLNVQMLTIGSNSMSLWSATPQLGVLTSNIVMTFNVYNIATTQLIASDNAAFINTVYTFSPSYGGGVTKNVSIVGQVKILSNVSVTSNINYSSQISTPDDYQQKRTTIWVRYDSTKPFTSSSSYDYLSYPGTGAPKPWYDITGHNIGYYPEIYPTSDGRYIYSSESPYLYKVDTQNFLDQTSYTYFNVATLTYPPTFFGWVPNTTDGRNIYFAALNDTSGLRIPWYDSTKSISAPAAYSNYLYTGLPAASISNGTFFVPNSFDGRSVYYTTGTNFSGGKVISFMTILRFDTVTKTVTDWIIFDGTGKAKTSYGTTVDTIAFSGRTDNGQPPPYIPTASYVTSVVGSRYVYISEIYGGQDDTFTDFVQFDPLVMTPTLSSSLILKYEKYEKPPVMPKMLYGQTDLNEFTMRTGRKQDQFQLRFQGPVREFWVTVDSPGTVARLRLLFNGEVIVDDDQVTTRTIRAFENHTAMPSSSNVCTYSFAIEPEKLTPSGTVNFSRIATPMLEVTLASAPVTDLTVRVYAKTFNVLTNQNGLGGLLFNSAL
jgi:hypothetical protein